MNQTAISTTEGLDLEILKMHVSDQWLVVVGAGQPGTMALRGGAGWAAVRERAPSSIASEERPTGAGLGLSDPTMQRAEGRRCSAG
ncbi:uncharacterized protein A4U43_C06F9230 [Asparagus officinalis]|uniref:Uncharacterized protein n=1 Tax=Asparagus officinalis TaxID=4686 RepID=A0A5P1EKL4_ASPOF|nr:uncharacterized protein A4U43_C06F9230 [Asparagus officinalis]